MLKRDDVLEQLTEVLETLFEVPAEDVRLDAHLYDDLDLDSIDAVDLAIKLQDLTGRKISPEDFKTVRTVGDVVDQVTKLVSENAASA